jgi:thioredoxin-like negative regulator of GroEL
MAWLTATLSQMDPGLKLEARNNLHSICRSDLLASIEQLLTETADHYQATRGIVAALAPTNADLACEISTKLNTVRRRDAAFSRIVRYVIRSSSGTFDLPSAERAIAAITSPMELPRFRGQ